MLQTLRNSEMNVVLLFHILFLSPKCISEVHLQQGVEHYPVNVGCDGGGMVVL